MSHRFSLVTTGRLIVLTAALIHQVAGQVDTGAISGFVRDATKTGIPGAKIEALETETGQKLETKADDAGFFSIPDLKPGVYDFSASGSGFETVKRPGVSIHLQDRLALDFELPVGRISTFEA